MTTRQLSMSSRRGMPTFYIAVCGCAHHGSGSGYACFESKTAWKRIKMADGLTNNEAMYWGLRWIAKHTPERAAVTIFSDSQVVVRQFNGECAVYKPELRRLLNRVRQLITARELTVKLLWIPGAQNLAAELFGPRWA